MLAPINHGTVFQGYNAMVQGWWADGIMTVDNDGNSNLVINARRQSKTMVAGASVTGVPLHIVLRDNG